MLQVRKAALEHRQEKLCSLPIRNICWMNLDRQEQALYISQDMAFTALDLFLSVIAAYFADTGGFQRLAINDRRSGLYLLALFFTQPQPFAQLDMDFFPRTILAPAMKE